LGPSSSWRPRASCRRDARLAPRRARPRLAPFALGAQTGPKRAVGGQTRRGGRGNRLWWGKEVSSRCSASPARRAASGRHQTCSRARAYGGATRAMSIVRLYWGRRRSAGAQTGPRPETAFWPKLWLPSSARAARPAQRPKRSAHATAAIILLSLTFSIRFGGLFRAQTAWRKGGWGAGGGTRQGLSPFSCLVRTGGGVCVCGSRVCSGGQVAESVCTCVHVW
jgi:hypothetical protein